MELWTAAVCYFDSNCVTGLSGIKRHPRRWAIGQSPQSYTLPLSSPDVIHFFLISLYPISINNQNLNILPYDPLSFMNLKPCHMSHLARRHLCESVCLISRRSQVGRLPWKTPAIPQQSEASERNSQQIRVGNDVFFFLNELVIFSFKLRLYMSASLLTSKQPVI